MKSPWKELFLLYKEERKQFLFFSILIISILAIRWTIPYWYPIDEQFLEQVNLEIINSDTVLKQKNSYKNIDIVPFDINTDDTNKWRKLGFSKRQSEIILNFKSLIGGFESKQELKKVFIINDEKFLEIESFLFVDQNFKKINRETEMAEKLVEGTPISKTAKKITLLLNSIQTLFP